jgi:uncharacterized iron-regulated protein
VPLPRLIARALRGALAPALLATVAACTTVAPAPAPWETRLDGDAVVLLGEVHDHAPLQRLRLEVLRRALARGWRPAIAMEQLDRERQAAIDAARRNHPQDAQQLIAAAGGGTPPRGWNWELYRPVIELALTYNLPLVAADLSNADAARIVHDGEGSVFDTGARAALGLDRPVGAAWYAALEREIDAGHCHALPPERLPAMVRAQLTRDAVLAAALRAHAEHGVVLIAGNGHVRRDIGVPRWLGEALAPRVLAVGFLEDDAPESLRTAFDAAVFAPPVSREDPCAAFRSRR